MPLLENLNDLYHVYCIRCENSTGMQTTKEKAVRLWNMSVYSESIVDDYGYDEMDYWD